MTTADAARFRLCAGPCGRQIRPSRTTVREFPGTILHAAQGLCMSCYRRARQPEKYEADDVVQEVRTIVGSHAALTNDESAQAVCAQTDPDVFFPDRGGSNRDAKLICNGDPRRETKPCPIRLRCLEVALANGYDEGIWGGTSPRERRRMRSQKAGAAA